MGIGGRELATRERVALMKAGETEIVKGWGEEGKVASVFGRRDVEAEAVVAQRRKSDRSMLGDWVVWEKTRSELGGLPNACEALMLYTCLPVTSIPLFVHALPFLRSY